MLNSFGSKQVVMSVVFLRIIQVILENIMCNFEFVYLKLLEINF